MILSFTFILELDRAAKEEFSEQNIKLADLNEELNTLKEAASEGVEKETQLAAELESLKTQLEEQSTQVKDLAADKLKMVGEVHLLNTHSLLGETSEDCGKKISQETPTASFRSR